MNSASKMAAFSGEAEGDTPGALLHSKDEEPGAQYCVVARN